MSVQTSIVHFPSAALKTGVGMPQRAWTSDSAVSIVTLRPFFGLMKKISQVVFLPKVKPPAPPTCSTAACAWGRGSFFFGSFGTMLSASFS